MSLDAGPLSPAGALDAPIRCGVAGLPEHVAGTEEFERALAGRATAAPLRVAAYRSLGRAAREAETERLALGARVVRDALARAVSDPRRTSVCLASLDDADIHEDHGWRAIFAWLRETGPGTDPLALVALSRYRRHLAACVDALPADCEAPEADRDLDPLRQFDVTGFAATRPSAAADDADRDAFVRVPRGRPVPIPAREAPVPVRLANRRFELSIAGGTPTITDPQGRSWRLREGRNLVGRALFGEIVVDADYTDVSRSHLIVEVVDGRLVSITDVSSAGTSVPLDLSASPGRADGDAARLSRERRTEPVEAL